jgi:hypothetical protein
VAVGKNDNWTEYVRRGAIDTIQERGLPAPTRTIEMRKLPGYSVHYEENLMGT